MCDQCVFMYILVCAVVMSMWVLRFELCTMKGNAWGLLLSYELVSDNNRATLATRRAEHLQQRVWPARAAVRRASASAFATQYVPTCVVHEYAWPVTGDGQTKELHHYKCEDIFVVVFQCGFKINYKLWPLRQHLTPASINAMRHKLSVHAPAQAPISNWRIVSRMLDR